jgi:anaerobic selenocysteine-containing dehydrogenase
MSDTALRICPLCEANCGLTLTIGTREGTGTVEAVRGDKLDVFSHGFICPKGVSLGELHEDPTRLRAPLVRNSRGELEPTTWDHAFDVIRERLGHIIREYGAHSVGMFLGNPNVHSLSGAFILPALIKALGTENRFSASTVDQMPKQAASAMMFGTALSVPIPDIDRTDYFLMLGANPLVSNGSMMTSADFPGRLRALRKRGGTVVVVDPIRTRTAEFADQHLTIRPGSDAIWLAALANVIFQSGPQNLGAARDWIHPEQLIALKEQLTPFTPESVAGITGIDPDTTRNIAQSLMAADSAAVYGRMGTTTSGLFWRDTVLPMATMGSWLIDVINIAIGSLDRPGGVMFPLAVAGGPSTEGTSGTGHGVSIPGRRRTRVRSLPSVLGEFPVSALAEEIDTPDPVTGQHIRAVFVVGGNPIVSTPDSDRLRLAFESLDLLISVDPYLTATNALADVVLPVASPLTRPHHDVVFNNLAVRNQARYSPAIFAVPQGEMDEADVLLTLAAIAAEIHSGSPVSREQMDDFIAYTVAQQAVNDSASRCHGLDPADLMAGVAPRRGVDRILDLRIRSGPYGDGFGLYPDGLTLQSLIEAPHGIDLGPLQPRLPEVLRTPSGRIEIAPEVLLTTLATATDILNQAETSAPSRLLLIGRRQLRSNNSWMKDIATLHGGSNRPSAQMNPSDVTALSLNGLSSVTVSSDAGSITIPLEITEDVSPGCICIPHGWAEFNVNTLINVDNIDPLGGTAVLSGIPVAVSPA